MPLPPPLHLAALHYASRAGHTEVAAKLVIAGSHVACCDPRGITAAHLAAERGFSGACQLGCLPGMSSCWLLHAAGSYGLVLLPMLMPAWGDRGAASAGCQVLIFLLMFCLPCFFPCPADIVEKLLLAGYVADSVAGPLADGTEGGTALHLAAAQGWEEVRCRHAACAWPRLRAALPVLCSLCCRRSCSWCRQWSAQTARCCPYLLAIHLQSTILLPGPCASCRWCTSCCSLLPTPGASTFRRATLSTSLCCTATRSCALCCWMPAAGSQTAQVGRVHSWR